MDPAPPIATPQLEIAHVLFTDIVAYSQLPMDAQHRAIGELQNLVRSTQEFQRAEAQDELVCLPTGDGMALVFFQDAEAPVRCALELAATLKTHPRIPLRMGIHSGPVYRVADINANRNVAGGGINLAQRVMDCGDAGHILISKTLADVLMQVSNWKGSLTDLGEAEVKHGIKVHLFNLHTSEAGNFAVPNKLAAAARKAAERRARPHLSGLQWGVGLLLILLAGVGIGYFLYVRAQRSLRNAATSIRLRPSIAVLAFKNLSGRSDADWLSMALPDYLDSELEAGEQLRLVSGENVVHMQRDIILPETDTLATDTLQHIRNYLNADLIVLGSYTALGSGAGEQIRLDLRLQDTRNGDVVASASQTGSAQDLFEIVRRVSSDLRMKLGIAPASAQDANATRASLPQSQDAARFYSEGLSRLRLFDALGARSLLEKSLAAEPQFPLSHSALAAALSNLGFDAAAVTEAKKAVDLSKNLPREEKLSVEASYRAMVSDWAGAVKLYSALWTVFPDSLDYGLRLADAQIAGGTAKDGLATLQKLRALPSPAGDDPAIDYEEAVAAETLSDFKEEVTASQKALDKARARGAQLLAANALWKKCWALQNLGQMPGAQNSCEQAEKTYTAAGEQLGTARGLTNLGSIQLAQGNLDSALQLHMQALQIVRGLGAQKDIAAALENIANVYAAQGRLNDAKKNYQEAFAIAVKIGDKQELLELQNSLAADLYSDGDYAAAQKNFTLCLHTALEIGDSIGIATAKENIALVLYMRGDLPNALQNIKEAIAIQEKGEMRGALASSLSTFGDFLLAQDDLGGAEKNYQQSTDLFMQLGDKGNIAAGQLSLARLALARQQPAQAELLAKQAVAEFQTEKQVDNQADACQTLARALMAQNKMTDAQTEIAEAQSLSIQDRAVRSAVEITAARVEANSGKPTDAITSLGKVLSETKSMDLVPYELEAALAEGEIELRTNSALARAHLEVLENQAKGRDFLLIARKAHELRNPAAGHASLPPLRGRMLNAGN